MFEDYLILIMECTSLMFMLVLSLEEFLSREKRSLKDKLCALCLYMTMAALAIEAESYAFDGVTEWAGLTFACNMLSYAVGSWIISAFMFYVTALLDEKTPTSYIHAKIVLALGIIESIVAIVGAFLGKTFTYVDAVFEYGPWTDGLSMFQMVFIVYLLVYILANRKKLGKRNFGTLLIYMAFTVVTTLMEILFEDLPSFYFVGQALAMDIIYVENRVRLREDLELQKSLRLQISDQNEQLFRQKTQLTEQNELLENQQKQLEDALSMAQSANRAKTTFLNNMSHDIRTPMNAIIGYTNLAENHIDDKTAVQDYLRKIGQSSNHLLSLINDVLDMSRIESGKMSIEEKPENIYDIIQVLKSIVQADIKSRQLNFVVGFADITDENILCDRLRLNQVLLNVLSNAIKYTHFGGTISLRVAQKSVADNGYADYEFLVKDNGIGMSKEFVGEIFDPFTRVNSSTVSGIQGTGLGMAITKNIVDMMGGNIDIKSAEGEGTEVVINCTFKLCEAESERAGFEKEYDFKGKRILLVEDNEMNREIAQEILEEEGFIVETAEDGDDALEMVRAGIERVRLGAEGAADMPYTAFISKPVFQSDLSKMLKELCATETDEIQKAEKEKGYDLSGKKILIVEDNEDNLDIATSILSAEGIEISSAINGKLAVEIMSDANPGEFDLILMDIRMPVMNGLDAARAIRALANGVADIPIVALTANAFAEDKVSAIEAGMNDYITKPLNVNELKETLAKYL